MTFREASLIGAVSVGVRILLVLVSIVPEPGILPSTVQKCLSLLADTGLLTFFIVLRRKNKDALRMMREKEDVHTAAEVAAQDARQQSRLSDTARAMLPVGGTALTFSKVTLIGEGSAGLRVFLSLIAFVTGPGILFSTGYRILSLLADTGLLTFFIVLCRSQEDAALLMSQEKQIDGEEETALYDTRQRSRGTGRVKAVLVSVGIPLTVQLYLVGLLCLLSIAVYGHYDRPQESTGPVAAVFGLGIVSSTLLNFIITLIWHRQRFWALLWRGIAIAIVAQVVGVPLLAGLMFANPML